MLGARRGSGTMQGSWRALAAASRVVLLYHTGGDAPALADHHAMLLCPCADISGALTLGHSPPGAARLRPPRPACVLKVGRELLAERGGILGVQVDLVVGAIEREPDDLFGWAAGQIVLEDDAYFLGHLHLPAIYSACTVSWLASCDREQRRGSGVEPALRTGPDKSISDGQPSSCSYAELLLLMDTCAQVTADLRGHRLDCDHHAGRPDLHVLCVGEFVRRGSLICFPGPPDPGMRSG